MEGEIAAALVPGGWEKAARQFIDLLSKSREDDGRKRGNTRQRKRRNNFASFYANGRAF